MGMTLSVHTNDAANTFMGCIPVKFFGYTAITHLNSCKVLALYSGQTPEEVEWRADCLPVYYLTKAETLTFLHHYVSDAIRFIDSLDTSDDRKCKMCVSVYTEYAVLLWHIRDSNCESLELCWR